MMKKCIVPILLLLIAPAAFSEQKVRFAIGEWAPYTSDVDVDGKVLEHVVTEAYALEKVVVSYEYLPWKRSYSAVVDGTYVGTFPWSKTPEREKEVLYNTETLIRDESVFFKLKRNSFNWDKLDDLKHYKIGVTIGYRDEQTYKDAGIVAQAVPNEIANFKKILIGTIDAYSTSRLVGTQLIKKSFTPAEAGLFTTADKPTSVDEYFVLFTKKNPDGQKYLAILDEGLKKLKASGRYDQIVSGK